MELSFVNNANRLFLSSIKKYGVAYVTDNVVMATKSDIIFVCVKPNLVPIVLRECHAVIGDKLIISIAAGVTIDNLEGVGICLLSI